MRVVRKAFLRATELVQGLPAVIGVTSLRLASARSRASAIDTLLADPIMVDSPHGPIKFLGHGRLSYGRARGLLTKEPDSLAWIDAMEPGSVFWDIGANIGTLTLYAARREALDVWSFEPAAANYYNLAANCELNGYSKDVKCLQLGFSNRNRSSLDRLNVSQLMLGRSFSFKRCPKKDFPAWQSVQVWSIDDFIRHYDVPCPNHIKIDVPGLTNEILEGAAQTLARLEVKELQIETTDTRESGRRIVSLLAGYGFEIAHRNVRHRKRGRTVSTVTRDLVFVRTG